MTMLPRDPLGSTEQAAIADTVASLVRHDLRNRFGAIRNAAFYLKKRVERTDVFRAEARVPRFFDLIEEEIVAADAIIAERLAARAADAAVSTSSARAIAVAVANARASGSPAIAIEGEDAMVRGDECSLAVAVRSVLENAIEAGGSATVRTTIVDGRARIEISNPGGALAPEELEHALLPFVTTKPGRAGLGLTVAERLLRRFDAVLEAVPTPIGACVALIVPLASEAP